MKKSVYSSPYQITPDIVRLISEISETLGGFSAANPPEIAPMLRRSNRLRSIQASLAIENNTLTIEQVTAIVDGRRVRGHPFFSFVLGGKAIKSQTTHTFTRI